MAKNMLLSLFLPLLLLCAGVHCVTFNFENSCGETLWRASNPSIGDEEPELPQNTYEIFNMDDNYKGYIWVRTGCTTNASFYFSCQTGDCGTGIMECAGINPAIPITVLNFNINQGVVSYEVSLKHGQNVLVRIKPNGGTLVDGSGPCPMVDCNKNLNSVCPPDLIRVRGGLYVGCNSPCDVYKGAYCCDGQGCQPDEISLKYKGLCPLAHTWPGDYNPPVYQCKGADSYDITFCPAL